MKKYIALFRGINVGGNNKLPMKELVSVLEGLGMKEVRTYIQSGNVVFFCGETGRKKLGARISAAIKQSHGFEPWVLLLQADELAKAIRDNPFPQAEAEGNTLHFNFLKSAPPAPNLAGMEKIKNAGESFQLKGAVCYLHAPDGIGRSKLAASMERLLGVPMTGRNWNTVEKLREMMGKE